MIRHTPPSAWIWSISVALILITALSLRLYILPETIQFSADQGLDMVSILQIETLHTLPFVGPFLSIPNVYTPPTYYVITWFFYHVTQSVEGIVFGYAFLNMITIVVLMLLTHHMIGKYGTFIIGLLLATSSVMIDHSRTFWQPYPIQAFLSLFLLFLWYAHHTHRHIFLWISVVWYQVALSVYPSPILLLPYVIYQVFFWYRRSAHKPPVYATASTLCTMIASGLLLFFPQLIFEIRQNFPTFHSLLSLHTAQDTTPMLLRIPQNSYELFSTFFATNRLPEPIASTITNIVTLCGIALIWFSYKKHMHQPILFRAPWTLLIGMGGFIIYPFKIYPHRAWAFLPYLFLYLAYIFQQNWQHKHTLIKIGVCAFVAVIVGINLFGASRHWNGNMSNQLQQTKSVADFIYTDIHTRHIPDQAVGFFYTIPNDPNNGNYEIYRILFWLIRNERVSIPLNPHTVFMPYDYSSLRIKPIMYGICRGFTPAAISTECIPKTIQSLPYRELTRKTFGAMTVIVLSNTTFFP